MPVILHGPACGTYARTARLAPEEKSVAGDSHAVGLLDVGGSLLGTRDSTAHLPASAA